MRRHSLRGWIGAAFVRPACLRSWGFTRTVGDTMISCCNGVMLRAALWPFITVDPKLGKAAVAELERCIAARRFKGVKFHPWLQAFAPSMVKETMVDILKRAAAAGLPVLFHDGTPPYSTTFQIAATARWVPEATVVLGHAGLADYCLPAAQLVRDIPNLYACICGPRPAAIAVPRGHRRAGQAIVRFRFRSERLVDSRRSTRCRATLRV